jgi:hypothetical protein
MNEMALFEERPVRRVFLNEEWWFVITDIVSALTDSPAPANYLKKLRRSEKWIERRLSGQETRNKLTDYWADHDVQSGDEIAIPTSLIHEEWAFQPLDLFVGGGTETPHEPTIHARGFHLLEKKAPR